MPAAVTSFVSGAVPAVALWVPFNVTARDKVAGSIKLADASAYYPQAAIIDGWAAANNYYEPNKETLVKLIKGWAEANDYIVANSDAAMQALQKAHYSQTPMADIDESFKAQKMFTSQEWKKMYSDGTVTKWLQQTTDFFMANAGVKDFTPADKYFDPSLYLQTIA
jgi:NitT/TauT family transport system substrate-binding protein